MLENQIKGLIAIFLILAINPFIIFFSNFFLNYQLPILINHDENTLAIEVVDKLRNKGIYFTVSNTSANQLLQLAGIRVKTENDFLLENGMKLIVNSDSAKKVSWTEIDNSQRLALGMPIDLNRATDNDLLLIPGIGEITAKEILKLKSKKVHFQNIEELMEIKGIKDKKLAKLRPYLYLQKQQ
jgi:competence protein ComEA